MVSKSVCLKCNFAKGHLTKYQWGSLYIFDSVWIKKPLLVFMRYNNSTLEKEQLKDIIKSLKLR